MLSSIFSGNRPATEKKNRENGFSEKYKVCEALVERQTEIVYTGILTGVRKVNKAEYRLEELEKVN